MRMKIHFLRTVVFDQEIDPNYLILLVDPLDNPESPADRFLRQWREIALFFNLQPTSFTKLDDDQIIWTPFKTDPRGIIHDQRIVSIAWGASSPDCRPTRKSNSA